MRMRLNGLTMRARAAARAGGEALHRRCALPTSPRRRPARRRRDCGCSRHWRSREASTLRTSTAIALVENCRMFSASSTFLPRIRPATRLSLCARAADRGADRQRFLLADLAGSCWLAHQRLPFLSAAWPGNVRVGANSPSFMPTMSSLTETGHELAAVVDVEGQADELRQDRRTARPGLDRRAAARCPARLPPSSAAKARRTDLSRRSGPWLNPSSSRDATG